MDSDGTPHCWGDALSYWNGAKSATPVLIEGFTADEFRPGYFTSCGLRDGKVSCQGNNYFTHLGPQDRQFEVGEVVAIDGLPDIVELAPVGSTVYALDADGVVWAWGESGMVALLDDGTVVEWGRGVATKVGTDQWHVPRPVEGAADVVEIAAGAAHVLMVTSDGTIKAVGSNFSGQLGDGTVADPREVVDVKGIKAG